jgi:hypothetical protein
MDFFIGFLAGFVDFFIGFFAMLSVEEAPAAGAVVSVLVWASAGLSISAELTPSAISSFFKFVLRIAAKDSSVSGHSSCQISHELPMNSLASRAWGQLILSPRGSAPALLVQDQFHLALRGSGRRLDIASASDRRRKRRRRSLLTLKRLCLEHRRTGG